MTATEGRKTLSIKSKPRMWQVPSKIETIEQNLKDNVKAALSSYMEKNSKYPAPTYNEAYRLNNEVMQQINQFIIEAYRELQTAVKFSHEAKKKFELITENVNQYLIKEVGDHAVKFQDALENFTNPKRDLPKITLSSM